MCLLESSSIEKDLGALAGNKLSVGQQSALVDRKEIAYIGGLRGMYPAGWGRVFLPPSSQP